MNIKEGDKIVRNDGCIGRVIETANSPEDTKICLGTFADGITAWIGLDEIYFIGDTLVGNKISPQTLEQQIEEQRKTIAQLQKQIEPKKERLKQLRKQLWYLNNCMSGEIVQLENDASDDVQ